MATEAQVYITLTDVYVKLCKLEEKVAEMTPQGNTILDHEERLRGLERWKYALPSSLMLAIVSIVIAIMEVHK